MYIGQALKEIIQWPRPQGPNVLILEPAYSLEYGMPSTHAILALSIPVNLFTILLSRYEVSAGTHHPSLGAHWLSLFSVVSFPYPSIAFAHLPGVRSYVAVAYTWACTPYW